MNQTHYLELRAIPQADLIQSQVLSHLMQTLHQYLPAYAGRIGVAFPGKEVRAASVLLQRAEVAMYEAKARGRSGWCFFGRCCRCALASEHGKYHEHGQNDHNNFLHPVSSS